MEAVEDVAALGDEGAGAAALEASRRAVVRPRFSLGPGPTRATTAAACGALASLFLGALGPAGRHPLVQRHSASRSLVVSTVSSRLCEALRVDHPVARVVLEGVRGHGRRWGDSGLLSVFLATRLVQVTLEAAERGDEGLGVRRHLEALGRQRAMAVIESALGDVRGGLALAWTFRAAEPMLALVRGVVYPKARMCGLSPDDGEVDSLVSLICEAFVAGGSGGCSVSASVSASWDAEREPDLRRGVVVRLFEPPGAGFPERVAGPCTVALFTAGLDVDEIHLESSALEVQRGDRVVVVAQGGVSADDAVAQARAPAGPSPQSVAEAALFRAAADGLASAGVKVVLCQRTIATSLQNLLVARGILPVARLSGKHVQRVADATGAAPLTRIEANAGRLREALGVCSGLERLSVAGRPHVLIECPPDHEVDVHRRQCKPVHTLLLAAPDQHAADELEAVAEASLRVLSLTLRKGAVVLPGGGCAEAWLARAIRAEAAAAVKSPPPGATRAEAVLVARGMLRVAEVLEEACCALAAQQQHQEPDDLLGSLRAAAQAHGDSLYVGVVHGPLREDHRAEHGSPLGPVAAPATAPEPPRTVGTCHLLDLGQSKLEGLRTALDMASIALRVATVSRH